MRRAWKWTIGTVAVLVVLAVGVSFLLDEPLRRTIEAQMNARMKGYSARIGKVDFHPFGFSIDFYDVIVKQDAHPDPPVMRVSRLSASVQWAALLHARLVADFLLDEPIMYVDRTHFVKELEDPTPVKEHGWQHALQAMYPLKINLFRIRNGTVTYVDAGQAQPLTLRAINAAVQNIRNVKSEPDEYPSPLTLDAVVFDDGRLAVEGHADFLREPYAGVKGGIDLERVALGYFKPVAARYGFTIAGGTFGGRGQVEYSPTIAVMDLEEVRVDGLKGDYAYRKKTSEPVTKAAKTTAEAAKDVSNKPDVMLKARRISVTGATIGFINEEASPDYRVFMSDTDLVIENFSNHRTEGTATARLTGRFLGSGQTLVTAAFRPETNGPDFDVNARIVDTDLKRMNDLLRAHAKFDVSSGLFSVFSELRVKDGRVQGYVKPLFKDLDVYAKAQDEDKGFGQKLKEKAIDVAGKILKNRPRKEVATVAPIEGPLENPKASTWETLVGLIRNAFIRAILPGFERERERVARSGSSGRGG
jgi:hypothetical protein